MKKLDSGEAIGEIKKFMGIEDDFVPGKQSKPRKKPMKKNGKDNGGRAAAGGDAPWEDKDIPPGDGQGGIQGGRDSQGGAGQDKTDLPKATAKTTRQTIYAGLHSLCHLEQHHREEFRRKRGFTDATIDAFRFVSGGAYVAGVVAKLREEFVKEDLVRADVLREVNGTLIVNDQLLKDIPIIPYLDEDRQVYHIRPHKLGFKDIPNEVFSRYLLKERPEHIVLAEGEFKAVALHQWGVPVLSVPGVSSFGGKNLVRLIELLREFGVKRVTVIFDNEEKGNPDYPNFKQKADDRYGTQYWSYMMAYLLSKKVTTRVGWLPDEWREAGKIDFDGALAQGRTREEILRVIETAIPPGEYMEGLPEEARRVVRRKISLHFIKLNIRRDFNKYVATRYRGEDKYDEVISNFVINIKSSFFTSEGVVRNVELVNEYGERSDVFPLEPGGMAGVNEFKKFCFAKGNYVFEGTAPDLNQIWRLEFLRDSGELIYQPERIGRQKDGLWLFGNMAIKDGVVYRPDEDGVIWINGKGYRPQGLQFDSQGHATENSIPALYDQPVDIMEIVRRLKQSIGGIEGGYEACMGLGWVIMTIFSEDVFKLYKSLPILFPHGMKGGGKSTLMRWTMNFFGIETEGTNTPETSQNFIARALSYYGSLGCWFDEYRNDLQVTKKDGFFRSAYNRQLSGKGTATAFQAKGFSVHATVSITGEVLPKDSALQSRCVPLQLSTYKRDRTWKEWLDKYSETFSGFTYWLIMNYEALLPKILATIIELKDDIVQKGVTDRTAENWAICAGAYFAVVDKDAKFIQWVGERVQEIRRVNDDDHALNQFLEDLVFLLSDGQISVPKHCRVEKGKLYLWYRAVYEIWAIHYRKRTGREPFDRGSIQVYLKDEPYFLSAAENIRLAGDVRSACVLDIEAGTEAVKELAAAVENRQAYDPSRAT